MVGKELQWARIREVPTASARLPAHRAVRMPDAGGGALTVTSWVIAPVAPALSVTVRITL